MWIPAMIISYLPGGQNFDYFNVQLLAPCLQSWVPRKYRHSEMKWLNKNRSSQRPNPKRPNIQIHSNEIENDFCFV